LFHCATRGDLRPCRERGVWNLLLVEERIGCKKDEGFTRIVKVEKEGGGWKADKVEGREGIINPKDAVVSAGVIVSGGILADVTANLNI